MSHVTDFVLKCGITDARVARDIRLHPSYRRDTRFYPSYRRNVEAYFKPVDYLGWSAAPQIELLVQAIKSCDREAVIMAVAEAPWAYKDAVMLLVQDEHDCRPAVWVFDCVDGNFTKVVMEVPE